jgi:hypothetical protein
VRPLEGSGGRQKRGGRREGCRVDVPLTRQLVLVVGPWRSAGGASKDSRSVDCGTAALVPLPRPCGWKMAERAFLGVCV